MIIQEEMSLQKKLEILSDAAKYDVACTSSGVNRKGTGNSLGNSVASGICHSFSADGRCISLLKILFTNECIYDCKYCGNRSSNDVVRASFTPEEVCELTMEFYRRNYIEGLFLSSGILVSPNYTMELIIKAIRMLREVYHFNGYIHCKAIPGASPDLIETLGWYTDRMSINLELPTAESLRELAPHKNRKNILKPIRQVQLRRQSNQSYLGIENQGIGSLGNILREPLEYHNGSSFHKGSYERNYEQPITKAKSNYRNHSGIILSEEDAQMREIMSTTANQILPVERSPYLKRSFVPSGQSTQMIIGATKETDYQIMSVSQSLYDNFDLKRVFYSAFINVNQDSRLPDTVEGPPLLREHRLYQADWLLRFYGFKIGELLNEKRPNFNVLLDPKCDWALGNLEHFPVEINKASLSMLLRVPGIGNKSAQRIIRARKNANLNFSDLKRMGIVLKRAVYFITCNGKMMYPIQVEENFITRQLLADQKQLPLGIEKGISYQQLSLFDDVQLLSNQIRPHANFLVGGMSR